MLLYGLCQEAGAHPVLAVYYLMQSTVGTAQPAHSVTSRGFVCSVGTDSTDTSRKLSHAWAELVFSILGGRTRRTCELGWATFI